MKILLIFSISLFFLLTSCTYNDLGTSTSSNGKPDIFVAGFVVNGIGSGDDEVTFWKNGSKITLAVNYGIANSIFVLGNDVYVAGLNPYSAYWKNGELIQLERDDSYASSIFVSKTGDAYVAGRKGNSATYWKNGTATSLTNGSTYSLAYSIFVSEPGDVYVAGYTQMNPTENATATLWRNGIAQPLTDGSDYAIANSIFVSGDNVYVAGYIRTTSDSAGNMAVATLWKNGTAISLPDSSNFSFANSVFVSLTGDVYLAGTVGGNKTIPVYWKNGIAFLLPANDVVTGVSSIVELNNDVYISGTVGQHAVYWKNGVMTTLNDDAAPNGSSASSLFVSGKVNTTNY